MSSASAQHSYLLSFKISLIVICNSFHLHNGCVPCHFSWILIHKMTTKLQAFTGTAWNYPKCKLQETSKISILYFSACRRRLLKRAKKQSLTILRGRWKKLCNAMTLGSNLPIFLVLVQCQLIFGELFRFIAQPQAPGSSKYLFSIFQPAVESF